MPSLKPSLPFGQLPVLEIDGVTIGQSMAIARFLANEYGIAGSSNLVKAQVDEVVDVMNDLQDAMVRLSQNWGKIIKILFPLLLQYGTFFEKDEKVKAEKTKKVKEETIPNTLVERKIFWYSGKYLIGNIQANLEKVMETRGGQFFAGNSLSWAELHFLQLTESLETMSPKVREKYNKNMFLIKYDICTFSVWTPHPSWRIWWREPRIFPTSRNGWRRDP